MAKTVGSALLHGNAFVTYDKTPRTAPVLTPGFVLGAKLPVREENVVVVDMVVARNMPVLLEFGYQLDAPENCNIGPGFSVTVENRPRLTIGLTLQRRF